MSTIIIEHDGEVPQWIYESVFDMKKINGVRVVAIHKGNVIVEYNELIEEQSEFHEVLKQ